MSELEQEQKSSARQRLAALQPLAIEALEHVLRAGYDPTWHPSVVKAATLVLERTERDQLGIFSVEQDRAWHRMLTAEERQVILEIQDRCRERMDAQETEAT